MAGKGGGAWKVAYADFVTAMMAFFMVMWLVGQNAETKEAVEQYFQHPTVQLLPAWVSRGPHEAGGGSSKKHDGLDIGPEEGKSDKKNKHKRVREQNVRHAKMVVRTDGDTAFAGTVVLFDEDSATLNDDAKAGLHELVPLLAGKTNRIEVRGHTARRPPQQVSKFADDWQLSFARSIAVMRYLEEQGIEAARIRLSQAGAFEPPTEQQSEIVTQSRVEVYLLSEFVDTSPDQGDDAHGPHLGDDDHRGHGAEDEHAAHNDHVASDKHDDSHAAEKPKKKKPAAKPKTSSHGKPAAHGHGKPAAHGKSSGHGKPAAKPSGHGAVKKKPAAKSSHGH